jgi:hypothetical protein
MRGITQSAIALLLCLLPTTTAWAGGRADLERARLAAYTAHTTGGRAELVRAYIAAHSAPIPSFARQTGLACSACHYQFLALTPFGRKFKLEGYTLANRAPITETDSTNGGRLGLNPASMVSAMATAGLTHTQDPLPDAQNDAVALPQELSVFLAGRISPKIGLFSQLTYGGADGGIGIDNLDFRFASKTTIGGGPEVVYGVTLHNNPTIQDLWNTTPGWGFPFIGSEGAPSGAAGALIDGGLEQNVLGLGTYALVGNLVYGEVTVYRSAFQGATAPSDATGGIHGVAPYWRLALQKEWEHRYVMIGTFGMHTSMFPGALSGNTDVFSDIGVDAQFETKVASGNLVARGTWMREGQSLNATNAAGGSDNLDNTLKVLRVNTSYYPRQWLGVTAGYFQTTGTVDAGLYAPDPVEGSANGDPKTNGFIAEADVNPWENTRVGVQYTAYSKFNGGGTNYDGSGRNASGNNTLFVFMWVSF